jgi:hypothetical protein
MATRIYGPWSDAEDRIVMKYSPRTAARRLSGRRTRAAIIQRRFQLRHPRELPTKGGKNCWTPDEIAILREYYPIVRNTKEMKEYLPQYTAEQILGKAHHLRINRKYLGRETLKGNFELLDQIRMRAKEDGVPFYKLDQAIKSGHYFQDGARRNRKKINLRHVIAAVTYFGGNLVIDWCDRNAP